MNTKLIKTQSINNSQYINVYFDNEFMGMYYKRESLSSVIENIIVKVIGGKELVKIA